MANVDVPAWIDRQPLSSLQLGIVCMCGAAVMLDGYDAQIIGFVAPALIQEFKVQPAALAIAFSAGLFGILVGCLLLAPLADRFGRRLLIVVSVCLFGIASLLTARAQSLHELDMLRFITGVGLGACMPNAAALTAEYAPSRMRGSLTIWMFTGFSLGALLSGLLAAQVAPVMGWRSLFVIGGVLPLILVLVMVMRLPESVRYLAARGRGSSGLIASILHRIHPDPTVTPESVFVVAEESRKGFLLPHLFTNGRAIGTVVLWAIFFLQLFDLFLLASWTPTILVSAGLSHSAAVFTGAMQQAGSVIATLLLGPIFDRIGFYRGLIPLLVLASIGVVAMGSVGSNLVALNAAALFAGAGIMGGQTAVIVVAGAFYPTFIRATGIGWAMGVGRVGAVIAPLLGAVMVASFWSPTQIFMVTSVPPLIVAGLLLVLRQCTPGREVRAVDAVAAH
jgi:AAHS family 4-hydroxybenzoate transporter-like MFS transporter